MVYSDGGIAPLCDALLNVMDVSRGPGDTLVLRQGDTPEGDRAKVFWCSSNEITRIPKQCYPMMRNLDWVGYAPEPHALVFKASDPAGEVRLLPWRVVEALPRTPEALLELQAKKSAKRR